MDILFGDFETRSACDLRKCGADVYARHPSTDIMCFAYAFNDEPVELIRFGEPLPERVHDHIRESGLFVAHNAAFELAIWEHGCFKKYGWPYLAPQQTHCTMAMAYAMGLPGAMEKLAHALNLPVEKDMAGNRIMLQLSRPRKENPITGEITWWDDAEKFERMFDYCRKDVDIERMFYKSLLKLSEKERKLWVLDRKINDRGIRIDEVAVERAIELVEYEKKRLNDEMQRVTSNQVSTCNAVRDLTMWLRARGLPLKGVAKDAVLDALSSDGLDPDCRRALELRQEAAKASTAKLEAMRNGLHGGRIRGMFQYHAATTGRWGGRRVQLQNLPRPKLEQEAIDEVFGLFHGSLKIGDLRDTVDMIYGPPLQVISDCLRGFLVPADGCDFIDADWNAVEARVLAWLAGEEWVLEVFRTHGLIYETTAAGIFHVTRELVTAFQRLIGKVSDLACGFGGGVGAFQSMAKVYGVKIPDQEADAIKLAWRSAHPKTVAYWAQLETCAREAVLSPGIARAAGPQGRGVVYKRVGDFLWCLLPSGRVLCYPYPEIRQTVTSWGAQKDAVTYMAVDSLTSKWVRVPTYGGSLAENVTQAVARDLLAEAIPRIEAAGYPIVLHVHDEVCCEVGKNFGSVKKLTDIMSEVPLWASGLPLKAEGWRDDRYRKD